MANTVGYRSSSSDTNPSATSVTQLQIPTPSGVVDGDFLLATIAIAGGAGTSLTLPFGWTLIRRADAGTTIGLLQAYRFAQGEVSSGSSWVFGASGTHAGIVRAFTGVDAFVPIDADASSLVASSSSPATPSVTTSVGGSILIASIASNGNVTVTPPTGYLSRITKSQTNATAYGADTVQGGAGATSAATFTLSGAQVAVTHTLMLTPSVGQTSVDQARSALKTAFPPGAGDWYDWDNPDDQFFYPITYAIAQVLKTYGYDYADLMRQEVNPLLAKLKLPEWEAVLGITQNAASAVNKWIATRQTAVISKLRESGASTLANIRAALEPLLGFSSANAGTLQIIECNRAALTALHTYANNAGASIGGGSNVSQSVYVNDGLVVGAAGVQVAVTITSTNPEQLSFTLTGPNGSSPQASVTWAAASLPVGSVTSTTFYLYEKATSAGTNILGTWSLQVNTGAAACTLVSWSLFVEGVGAGQSTGGAAFEWGAYADPTKTNNPDLVATLRSIKRIQPGFSNGALLLSINAYPDTVSGVNASIPDQFIGV